MVDHRRYDFEKIQQYSRRIATIDDVYVPYPIRSEVADKLRAGKLYNQLFENQMNFMVDYRYEKYWRKGETRYEMDQRLVREFVEAYPELEILVPKSGLTVEEAQDKMKKLYPEHIPYDYTPKEV
ncbi:MAG: hypothetical protein IJI96_02700 [Methanobrevibacter sp.]|nr:hypothetical protein [Methanobrevibacter sp.]MBQ6627416.1 hypothetical protein [Methanobrevibacter sp.]